MGNFAATIGSTITQAAAQVFYVIRRGLEADTKVYLGAIRNRDLVPWRTRVEEAIRFTAVDGALAYVSSVSSNLGAVRGLPGFQIVRVEEHTTIGTKRRIEVPLGDPRQIGVAIVTRDSYPYNRPVYMGTNCWLTDGIREALVFPDQRAALLYLLKPSEPVRRHLDIGQTTQLTGIAEEATPGTTKYTETVLA